jgi:hypothetical protein
MKKHAARTGVEQPADLSKVFVIFKQSNKTYAVNDVDPSKHPMKRKVKNASGRDRLKMLNLPTKKENSLIDFISSFPEMATRAAT